MVVTYRYAACFICGEISSQNDTLSNNCNGQRTKAANTAVNKLLTGSNPYNKPWRPDGQPKHAKFKCYQLQIDIRSIEDENKEVRIQTSANFARKLGSQPTHGFTH